MRARGDAEVATMQGDFAQEYWLPAATTSVIVLLAWLRWRVAPTSTPGGTAAVAAFLALTVASPLWLRWISGRRGARRWRNVLVAAHRLTYVFCIPRDFALVHLGQPPTPGARGCLVDVLRVLLGSQVLRLLYGCSVPLDLPYHLLVHTAMVAPTLLSLGDCCAQPLLGGELAAGRIDALHSLFGSLATAGILPPGYPPGGPRVQCTAALGFLVAFAGWVVPTYWVLRVHQREAAKAAAAAGPGGAGAGACRWQRRADAAVRWALENVFMEGAPAQQRCACWASLAGLAWLACTLLAMAAA